MAHSTITGKPCVLKDDHGGHHRTRPRKLIGDLPFEQAESIRARQRYANMTPEQIKRRNARTRNGWRRYDRKHPLHQTWVKMIDRCDNPLAINYPRYGLRGIQVCQEWHDFRNFENWIMENIGARPEGKTARNFPLWTLDRIDNNGNYEPGNVRWANQVMQRANQERVNLPPARGEAPEPGTNVPEVLRGVVVT